MTPQAMAVLHARCFFGAPRPWTEAEFVAFLDDENTTIAVRETGFALARIAGPEAELLTIAVDPGARRCGTGRDLVQEIEARCAARRVCDIFLEVAETNRPAIALYTAAGYHQAGQRRNYYRAAGANPVSALVLCKQLPDFPAETG